jgi:hypothetical protein
MYRLGASAGPHPWEKSYIQRQPLEELLRVHNEMYYYLQEIPDDEEDWIRGVRLTASRIQEWLEQHGAVMLTGAASRENINIQLSAPAPAPAQPQQDIIERQLVQPQMQTQQSAQQDIIYRQQAFNPVPFAQQQPMPQPIQQDIIYQQQAPLQQSIIDQQQQQSQLFNIPAPAATLTLTSGPVQNLLIGRIGTPRIAYLSRRRRLRTQGLLYYSSDSD